LPARGGGATVVGMTPPNLTSSTAGFSVDTFAQFWAAPDVSLVSTDQLHEDVVGDWPRAPEPVRGFDAYRQAIADLLDEVPDLKLEVAEHATNGEYIFIRWIARATGAAGPFEISGIDRIRVVDGRVKENIIRFDSATFDALVGGRAAA
jgi:hypothetical protein